MHSNRPPRTIRDGLGATLQPDGCEFRLLAPEATAVDLTLVDDHNRQVNLPMVQDEGVWRVFAPGVGARQRYGYRVSGQWSPDLGHRPNPAKLLTDPYARAITGGLDPNGFVTAYRADDPALADENDSLGSVPLSVVVASSEPPVPIARRTSLASSVIYEIHLKGFTRLHPMVPEHLRGTYAGLAHPAVTEYLRHLGVTAVELLPVHHFVSEPGVSARGLTNYWGYNTLGFFAPHAAYCSVGSLGEQVTEFKQMVSALHEAGIEVILDVVYNHTCEGNCFGPTICYRGLTGPDYYRFSHDHHTDYDVTGCGNSVDTAHHDVCELVLDSMRYWVTEMGVDGFRFDLATTLIRDQHHHVDQNHYFKRAIAADPAFNGIKMIAEPWDMGPFGYQVGRWGSGWSEWNDRFRGFMRDYWRGVTGVQELATRLTGSADLFGHDDRPPSSSINFITAHDGFTLRDLTTYNHKHNEANGEQNSDGSDDNRSWNCGVEGETVDDQIVALRHRQVRNMMASLLLARGVPMITAGDEFGRTQAGNNNAYCQDNPLSWVNWTSNEQWDDVRDLTADLLRLRTETRLLTYDDYLYRSEVTDAKGNSLQRYNLAWLNGYSGEMGNNDWQDHNRRLLGMYLSSRTEALLIWFYAGAEPVQLTMPPIPWGWRYQVIASTAEPGELSSKPLRPGDRMELPGRTVAVMRVEVPSSASSVQPPLSRRSRGGRPTRPAS